MPVDRSPVLGRSYPLPGYKARRRVRELEALLADLVDPDPCEYDHHGLCQAHHLHERPCPHERAKALGINAR